MSQGMDEAARKAEALAAYKRKLLEHREVAARLKTGKPLQVQLFLLLSLP